MKSEQLLHHLISKIAAYEATLETDEELEINGFLAFARDKEELVDDPYTAIRIAQKMSTLHRYSKFYVKKILKKSMLQTVDEYTYLASLSHVKSLTKTELNNMNVMEKTSGNEVIRRLSKAGLVSESRDKDDRRSMRVYITEIGRAELARLFPELNKAAIILSGKLTGSQKKDLMDLQETLCSHHQDMFLKHKEEELDQYLSYLSKK